MSKDNDITIEIRGTRGTYPLSFIEASEVLGGMIEDIGAEPGMAIPVNPPDLRVNVDSLNRWYEVFKAPSGELRKKKYLEVASEMKERDSKRWQEDKREAQKLKTKKERAAFLKERAATHEFMKFVHTKEFFDFGEKMMKKEDFSDAYTSLFQPGSIQEIMDGLKVTLDMIENEKEDDGIKYLDKMLFSLDKMGQTVEGMPADTKGNSTKKRKSPNKSLKSSK